MALAADRDESGVARADAGAKRTAVVLGAGLLVAVTAIVAASTTETVSSSTLAT